MRPIIEHLQDLKDHWTDGYWWADRQFEAACLSYFALGAMSLGFAYVTFRMRRSVLGVGNAA